MARGTANTAAGKATGDALAAATANDVLTTLVSSDDDALYELLDFEPPAGVTSTTPRVGFIPLRNGPVVTGDIAARTVTVAPTRAFRSSVSNATPRAMLSATSFTTTQVNMPTVSAAGQWTWELLYAELTYVNSAKPEMGTQVQFYFAPSVATTSTATAPSLAALPANTATLWNVPIAWVKNLGGATTIANEDIIEYQAVAVAGFAQEPQPRIAAKKIGVDARRAYSSANNDPTKLVNGSTSQWLTKGTEQKITSTITSVSAGRHNVEWVRREILIPAGPAAATGGTAGTGGAALEIVVDDTRDWRGANFRVESWISATAAHNFSEEDASVTAFRGLPVLAASPSVAGVSMHVSIGNSWLAYTPGAAFGSAFWAAVIALDADVPGAGSRNGVANVHLASGDGWALKVDSTTGALIFWSKRAGASSGPPIWMIVEAWFGNHRP